MADAPAWLREAFRDGVDDREMVYRDGVERFRLKRRPYVGANPWCWLAQFDPKRVPCGGQPGKVIERFHFINRQRVETAVWAALPDLPSACPICEGSGCRPTFVHGGIDPLGAPCDNCDAAGLIIVPVPDLIHVAAWDSRNGGLACEHHHRRFDHHSTPDLVVPAFSLPEHELDFISDYGLELEAEQRFAARQPSEAEPSGLWSPLR